jgi:hypothetical protein
MEHGEKFKFLIEKLESYICILTANVTLPLSSVSCILTPDSSLFSLPKEAPQP